MPLAKYVPYIGDGLQLVITDSGRGIFKSMGEDLKAVRYAVFRCDGGDSDRFVSGIKNFRHNDVLGIGIDGLLAAVVLKGDTSDEAFFGAEFIRFASTMLIVDEDRVSKRDKRGGIVVKVAVEVLPSRDLGIDSELPKKVKHELSMIQQMVTHVL